MQGGLFSRRRKPTGGGSGNNKHKKSPLLPTNTPSSSSSSSYKSNFSPMRGYTGPSSQRRMRNTKSSSGGSDTCSSFVFGGSYYPGKDKRRTRGLGYRIFCSSIPRSILFSVLIGYGVVRYVLSPIGELILGLGTILATDPDSNRGLGMPWGDGDDDVLRKMLPSLEAQRAVELERMEGEEHDGHVIGKLMPEQLEVLKGIVSDWATRNIVFGSNDYEEEGSEDGDDASRESADAEPHDEPSNDEDPFLRTLQRMDTSQTCTEAWPTNPSISLVMQSTLDRLWLLEETCKRWTDPIIVVVYYDALTDVNTDTAAAISGQEHVQEPWLPILDWTNRCPQVTFIPFSKQDPTEESWQYPINKLRNVGLDNIETSHFVVVDIDFIPSSNLPYVIKQNLKHVTGERDALVIPAFERVTPHGCSNPSECQSFLKEDTSFIPSTFDELKTCHDAKDCIVFQSHNNWEGHFTTNSESWLRNNNDDASGPPRRISCFHSFRYEPYVVLRYCDDMTPLYDERFYGYGKNKIEYISHLRFLNYGFRILPEGFIVHHPHPESDAKSSWNDSEGFDLHSKMDELYPTFLKELYDRYGKPDLLQCQRKKRKV